jgi:hypothetical protein
MESTWETRDLPVLDAIVRSFDEHDGPEIPDVGDLREAHRAGPRRRGPGGAGAKPTFIKTAATMGGLTNVAIMGVTDVARQAVGQWPSPEVWVDRLVLALREAAGREPDPARRGDLHAMAEGLGGFARDVAVGVLSGGITQSMGS